MSSLQITSRARSDLRSIALFIIKEHSKALSKKYVDQIKEKIQLLRTFPNMGSIPKYSALSQQGFRFLSVESHLIFYKYSPATNLVSIHRILHYRSAYQEFL